VSFSGLNKGDQFTAESADYQHWAQMHVENGYLREVTAGEPTVAATQGLITPVVPEAAVQEARDAGPVGKG
jgi:hypothetical protein